MTKRISMLVVASCGLFLMSGCAAQLSETDLALMNSAIESGKASSAAVQQAEDAAARAEQAAKRAEAAAQQAMVASVQADAASQSAAASAGQATTLAGQAQQNAIKAERAFDLKLKK